MRTRIEGKEECINRMHQFITLLKLPTSLKALGIKKTQVDDMANSVSGNLSNDPASQEENIIKRIYENAWEGA